MKGLFSASVSTFHSAPRRLDISELCIFGLSCAIFRLCPRDQTMKAFMGLLMWSGGLLVPPPTTAAPPCCTCWFCGWWTIGWWWWWWWWGPPRDPKGVIMVLLFFAFQRSDEKWKGVANARCYPRSLSIPLLPHQKTAAAAAASSQEEHTEREREREKRKGGEKGGEERAFGRPTRGQENREHRGSFFASPPLNAAARRRRPPPPPPFFPFAPRRSPFWGFVCVCVLPPVRTHNVSAIKGCARVKRGNFWGMRL